MRANDLNADVKNLIAPKLSYYYQNVITTINKRQV